MAEVVKRTSTQTRKKAKRYSNATKAELLAQYNQLRQAGNRAQDAADQLGVPYITLRSWEKKNDIVGRQIRATQVQNALVQTQANTSGMTLLTPDGNRIEGISLEEVIAVLKALR